MYKKILLASDGSIDAGGGLEVVISLCAQYGAEMTLLLFARTAAMPMLMAEVDRAKAAIELKSSYISALAQRRAEDAHIVFRSRLVWGPFVERTLEFIEESPHDLLVIGSGVHHTILNFLFPSTIERLVRHSPCSVLVIKGN